MPIGVHQRGGDHSMRLLLPFLLIMVAIIVPSTASAPDTLTVTFLDVGQADSIIVRAPNGHAMLVDAGEQEDASTIEDALADEGISRVDFVVATHDHNDHIGGMVKVLRKVTVGQFVTNSMKDWRTSPIPTNLRTYLSAHAIATRTVTAGDTIALDPANVTVTVLNPPAHPDGVPNDASIVLRLVFGGRAFLLAGDAESTAEGWMLASGRPVASQVLKVGHHGADTSTGAAFVAAVDPAIAVISVGEDNPYGLPDSAVVRRLQESGARVYRTDADGTVRIAATRTGFEVETGAGSHLSMADRAPTPSPVPVQTTTLDQSPPTLAPAAIRTLPGAQAATVSPVTAAPASVKRYAVGNPGTFIGKQFGSAGTPPGASAARAVIPPAETVKPGSRAYGIMPPRGRFIRWSPAARWQAHLG